MLVNDLLNAANAELLLICIDDTDLSPHIGEHILQALQIYLSHPRIVTIISANFPPLTNDIFRLNMARLKDAVAALPSKDHHLASRWRKDLQARIFEYLEKVLPPSLRMKLRLGEDDLPRILGRYYQTDLWKKALRSQTTHRRNAFGWWLLGQGPKILVSTMREIIHFHTRFTGQQLPRIQNPFRMLQDRPSCYLLQHNWEKVEARHLKDLISESLVRKFWPNQIDGGQCYIIGGINSQRFYESDALYHLLDYLVDADLSIDLENVPGWLHPLLTTHSDLSSPEISSAHFRLGLAAPYAGTEVPRNCLYIRHLGHLSKILFSLKKVIAQEARLSQPWDAQFEKLLESGKELTPIKEFISPLQKNHFQSFLKNAGTFFRNSDPKGPLFGQMIFPILFLGWKLVGRSRTKNIEFEPFLTNYLENYLSLIDLSAKGVTDKRTKKQEEKFLIFLQKIKEFFLTQAYQKNDHKKLMRNALILAMVQESPQEVSPQNILATFRDLSERDMEIRQGLLLAWALAPSLSPWLGFEGDEVDLKPWKELHQWILSLVLGSEKTYRTIQNNTPENQSRPQLTDPKERPISKSADYYRQFFDLYPHLPKIHQEIRETLASFEKDIKRLEDYQKRRENPEKLKPTELLALIFGLSPLVVADFCDHVK